MHDAATAIRERLTADHAPDLLIDLFLGQVRQVQAGGSGVLRAADLADLGPLPAHADLARYTAAGRNALGRTVLIKLNGGLGTGMGLNQAKSLLPVRDGLRFIDLIARQVLALRTAHRASLPLLLMNSATTEAGTETALREHPDLGKGQPDIPTGFRQHRVPRLDAETLAPVETPHDPDAAWCPPGHGDLYTAMATTGVLDTLLDHGIRYAFVSNADNLGATMDLSLLGYLAAEGKPFLMEVTRRTPADRKGGHLARSRDGRLLLRESAQCPPDETGDFQDIDRYSYFNTNNLWIDLSALKALLDATGKPPALALIVNRKTVKGPDGEQAVVQLETAMGSAIGAFDGAEAVEVPRSRFSPVKTTDDFLALRSDAYILTDDYRITLNPARPTPVPPAVSLDPRYYKTIDAFQQRFPSHAPSLLHCRELRIEGDITFAGRSKFHGTVRLHAPAPVTIFERQFLGRPEGSDFTVA